jgi:hypothetical protein
MNENAALDQAPAPASLPAPELTVLGVDAVRHAAAPTLRFTGHVAETSGREVYTIALTVQIMIDPARRTYDDESRARLIELFGEPERWATTTHTFLWAELFVLVPAFTGATSFRLPMACNYDLEIAASKYLHSLPGGEVPLTFNFSGTIFYRGDGGQMQIVQVPWDCTARYAMPVSVWQEMVRHYYPNAAWVALRDDTMEDLGRRKARLGLPSFDATVAELMREVGK